MRDLKFKLNDATLVSDVNQTLSNLLTQIGKTNKVVGGVSQRVIVNTRDIAAIPPPTPATLAVGSNLSDLPWNFFNRGSSPNIPTAGFTYCQAMWADSIIATPPATAFKISIGIDTVISAPIGEMCLIRTIKGSLTTLDVTPITFAGNATPTFSSTGTKQSDPIGVVIDCLHDYYICFTGNAFGGSGALQSNNVNSAPTWNSYAGNVNSATKRSTAWASSVGAGGGFSGAFPLGFGPYFVAGWVAA